MTNQWWDSLFYGRHALISIMAISILAALVAKKWTLLLLVLYLSVCSFSSLNLLRSPAPYQSMQIKINGLSPGGLLVESHFARPQTTGEYFGEVFYVGEPGYETNKLVEQIDSYLTINKPVFVTGQVLSEPYGLFNGPYLHSLTLSYKQPFLLNELLANYSFEMLDSVDANSNLTIYRVKMNPGTYPDIKTLIDSNRRLDKNDAISKMVLNLFSYSK
jgi:hypothetical protein